MAELFPDRATIQRPTTTNTESGGVSSAYADVAVDVPVLFSGQDSQEVTRQANIGEQFSLTLTMPGGTDVQMSDRIVVTSIAPQRAFEVQSVGGGGSWEVKIPVVVREVRA